MPDPQPAAEAYRTLSGLHTQYMRCWPCMLGQHVGGEHDWISEPEDEVYLQQLQVMLAKYGFPPLPREELACTCRCVEDLSLGPDTEPPDIDEVSLSGEPCTVCGEQGACGYDQEGRAMIHTTSGERDE